MSQIPPPPPPPAPGFPPPPGSGFPQPQQPYGGGGGGYPAPQGQQSNGLAIGSLICGIVGCLLITPLLGIILGVLGLKDARKKGGSGRGLAIAGIVLSVLWLGVFLLFSGGIFALFNASKAERDLAAAFARDVAAGNVDAAMARTTSTVSRDEVSAAADKLKPLGSVTNTTMFGVSGQASTTTGKFWMIAGAVTFNATQVGYAAKVVDENGTPKIDGFTFTVNGTTVSGGNPGAGPGGMTPTTKP